MVSRASRSRIPSNESHPGRRGTGARTDRGSRRIYRYLIFLHVLRTASDPLRTVSYGYRLVVEVSAAGWTSRWTRDRSTTTCFECLEPRGDS